MSYPIFVIETTQEDDYLQSDHTTPWKNWLTANKVTASNLNNKLKLINAKDIPGSSEIEFATEQDAMMWLLRWS